MGIGAMPVSAGHGGNRRARRGRTAAQGVRARVARTPCGLRPRQEQVMLAGAVLVPLTLAVNPTVTEPPAGIVPLYGALATVTC